MCWVQQVSANCLTDTVQGQKSEWSCFVILGWISKRSSLLVRSLYSTLTWVGQITHPPTITINKTMPKFPWAFSRQVLYVGWVAERLRQPYSSIPSIRMMQDLDSDRISEFCLTSKQSFGSSKKRFSDKRYDSISLISLFTSGSLSLIDFHFLFSTLFQ